MTTAMLVMTMPGAAAAAPAPADRPTTQPATRPAGTPQAVAFKGISIDLKKRQVVVDTQVCLRAGALELLLCRRESKEHESILHTDVKGAHIHAALLALGLKPGRAARWTGTDENAAFLPPRGPELKITLQWRDESGKMHETDASAWLKPTGQGASAPQRWVFVGSKVLADGRYWADVDGDVISVANFASAVIDVPFESTKSDAALEFEANTEAIPPLETPVQVVITPLPGAEKSPYATAMLEIDAFGRLRIDGRPIAPQQLQKWAAAYVDRHSKGFVLVRAHGEALVADVRRAVLELWTGGVRSYDVERLGPAGVLLPRTPQQMQRDLAEWSEKFKSPRDYLMDPGEQAKGVVEQIDRHLRRLDAERKVLEEYSRKLQAALEQYERPAETP
jgi:hypothetical protein